MTSTARPMTENDLLTAVIDAAHLYGWRAHHIRNSKAGVTQGDPGFPDLCLARNGRVLFLEIKDEKRKLTQGQADWIEALPDAYLVRPHLLDAVLRMLA